MTKSEYLKLFQWLGDQGFYLCDANAADGIKEDSIVDQKGLARLFDRYVGLRGRNDMASQPCEHEWEKVADGPVPNYETWRMRVRGGWIYSIWQIVVGETTDENGEKKETRNYYTQASSFVLDPTVLDR